MEEFTWAQELMFTNHGYPADDAAVTATLKELGRRISAVLRRESGDDFLDSLATLLAEQDCRPYLTRHDGRPHLHYARDDAPPGSGSRRWRSPASCCTCARTRTTGTACAGARQPDAGAGSPTP